MRRLAGALALLVALSGIFTSLFEQALEAAAESAAQAIVADLEKQLELLPGRNDLSEKQRQQRGKQLEVQLGPARQAVETGTADRGRIARPRYLPADDAARRIEAKK